MVESRIFKYFLTIQEWHGGTFYQAIGMANAVLKYAPGVMEKDESYHESQMNSHCTEAYFIRGLMYLYLVRNYGEVPLITEPYVDDEMPTNVAKSSEQEILEQIKSDMRTALDTNAAKEFFEDSWATKGQFHQMGFVCVDGGNLLMGGRL